MKKSELRDIIKEEIYRIVDEADDYGVDLTRFKEKIGFKEPDPSIKNIIPRIYFGRALELIYDVQYDAAESILKQLSAYASSNYYYLSLFWLGEIAFRKIFTGSFDYFAEEEKHAGGGNHDRHNHRRNKHAHDRTAEGHIGP